MKTKVIALLLLLTIPLTSAIAERQWRLLGGDGAKKIYLDPTDVRSRGDYASVWQKMEFTPAVTIGAEVVSVMIAEIVYHCKMGTSAYSSYYIYSPNGNMKSHEVSELQFSPINESDLLRYIAMKKTCSLAGIH